MLHNIYRGNTVAFSVQPKVDGTAVAVQGTIKLIIKSDRSLRDEDAELVAESSDGNFVLDAADTADLEAGKYFYEFRWYFSDAEYTLDIGDISVCETVFD